MILEKSSAEATMAEIFMKYCLAKRHQKMCDHCDKEIQENAEEDVLGEHLKLLPALGLVLPDDAHMTVRLALDPVLKYATCLGELLNNPVAALSVSISARTRRKVQGLPNGKFMRRHVLLQQAGCRRLRRRSAPSKPTRLEG
jgi:hypothetical protein